ncbi:unnamed protein product [Sphagnum jensenii]
MYGKCGNMKEAYNTFNTMLEKDWVAWSAMIIGLVDEGLQYFLSMWRVHSISLSDEHFGYIFDLLGHTGHIYETEDFVSKLPQSRSSATCGVELYVFRLHGNVKLANMEHKSVLS